MKNILVLAILALAGCASHWSKPGGTEQQFNADFSQCLAQAGGVGQGNDLTSLAIFERVRNMCMIGKGWHQV